MLRDGATVLITLGRVIASQLLRYRGGEHDFTTQFEKDLTIRLGVKRALTVNSGTIGLISALAAMIQRTAHKRNNHWKRANREITDSSDLNPRGLIRIEQRARREAAVRIQNAH